MLANHVSYNRVVQQTMTKSVLRYVAAAALVFAIVYTYHTLIRVNPTIVALTFLLAVLVVSARWGLRHAVFMAIVATLAFNYFFLPPVGTFTITDPQNWAALFAFLASSLIASQLSARARRQADEAGRRRDEVERLYSFSQHLLTSGNVITLLNAIPNHIGETFGVGAAALYLDYKQKFYHSGAAIHFSEDEMRRAMMRDEPLIDLNRGLCFAPVRIGTRPIGSLAISGRQLSPQTLEALGTLI